MKSLTKIVAASLMLAYMTTGTYAAYEEVTCSADAVYGANSCDQCFTGGAVSQGDNKGLLNDVWNNDDSVDQVLFKEEQEMPSIISLGGASWTEVTASDSVDFWTYTQDLDNLYSDDSLGNVLAAGQSVTWIESTVGSAYQLTSNPVAAGGNVWMIVYDIAVHNIESDGAPSTDAKNHRECVLYTSGAGEVPPVVPENPKLPETGAEHILLAFVALILGFGFLKFRNK